MAHYEYFLKDDTAYITVLLPYKFENKRVARKIMSDTTKLVSYCNRNNDEISDIEKSRILALDRPECRFCHKTFKRVNGLTSHIKTCKSACKNEENEEELKN